MTWLSNISVSKSNNMDGMFSKCQNKMKDWVEYKTNNNKMTRSVIGYSCQKMSLMVSS